ncbi:hypothetical protein [Nocardioides caricicola]|uniref:DUF732 domain-containing protein n=1 Tax=Nocardioides caricicola TaxID=634770 RepID=A0ABW0N2A5_9ACTN
MRRTLGTLALLLTIAGCGSDTAVEGSPDPPSAEVILVSGSAGGGRVESEPTDVSDDADLDAYVAQFGDALAADVSAAVRKVDGDVVLAQVVSVGCDVPPGASLQDGVIVAEKVAKPLQECFAPVTTVGVAAG